MLMPELVDSKHTAVLVIDLQNDFCSPKGKLPIALKQDVAPIDAIIPKISDFLAIARNLKIPIIFFRMNEDVKKMTSNAKIKKQSNPVGSCCVPGTWGFDYYRIKPEKGDFQLVKNTYDAFATTELEKILRKKNVKNVILSGVLTNLCIDSTARSAFTKGYNVIIPKTLVASTKEQKRLHDASLESLDMLFAHVTETASIIRAWK